MNIKKLTEEVDGVWSKTDSVQALIDCCKKICNLSTRQLHDTLITDDNEHNFEMLMRVLKKRARMYDPEKKYETIYHAILLLDRTMSEHEERTVIRTGDKHGTRASSRRYRIKPANMAL